MNSDRKEHLLNLMQTEQNILQDRASFELDADRTKYLMNWMQTGGGQSI